MKLGSISVDNNKRIRTVGTIFTRHMIGKDDKIIAWFGREILFHFYPLLGHLSDEPPRTAVFRFLYQLHEYNNTKLCERLENL